MRAIGFIIAFTTAFASPSFSDSGESSLPGIGTFSYGGSGVTTSAPDKFAYLTLTRRG